ncbi:MAG: ABC transporter permease [Caldilineaceae bacterium]|nr:ABC transporter permease [Caldilineaceae bacterium]
MQWLNNVMIGLLIGVAGVLLYILLLGWRNPVLVKIGLRNIPRRPAQSALIVLGLTLSTIIILSSLTTGDTLTYSVRRHAVQAYGMIDEIIAPPLLSALAGVGNQGQESAQTEELNRLMEGGLTSVLTVLEGGLPGISMERLAQLKIEAESEPQIDAVAGSIIFPTIIRNANTGQGEPLGFIFAVDDDYDQTFGLNSVDGTPVEIESLQPGVSNIFAQAANLFTLAEGAVSRLGLTNFRISDVALATAAIGAALTTGAGEGGVDLSQISIPVATLAELGIDTTVFEEQGIENVDLASLGLTPETLSSLGVTTTTVNLGALGETVGIDSSAVQTATTNLLNALNLNTLGAELDRVLAQFGLQLRQGDVYLNRVGAGLLDARVGDVLEVYIGPIPLPFRVRAIVDQASPVGALAPVVMLRLDEAQKLLFMNGKVNNILVSNVGDEIEGIEHTEAVSARLKALALDPAAVDQVFAILQRPQVRSVLDAEAAGYQSEFDREYEGPEFLRGIISDLGQVNTTKEHIAALAAEVDAPAPTLAFRDLLADLSLRSWIGELPLPADDAAELQPALAALNRFDVLDPLSKSSVVQVADIGGLVFSSIFSVFGILSILAGVLLIFLIFVMMAAERRSEMGMARAIGVQRSHLVQMFVTEGVVYDLAAAALGVLLGLAISYAMVGLLGTIFNQAAERVVGQSGLFRVYFRAAPVSIVIAYCLGVLFTFVVVTVAAWRVSRLNIVSAIRDLPEPPGVGRTTRWGRAARGIFGPLVAALGGLVLYYGAAQGWAVIQTGISLLLVGALLLVGWLLEHYTPLNGEQVQRIVYSTIGLGFLAIWAMPLGRWLGRTDANLATGGPWALLGFVVGGPLIVLGAILLVMFSADTLAALTTRVFSVGALTPVLRTAIAYPLSARFRTGMAMLLFAMVISTVTLMTVVIEATQTLVAPDTERNAGFDIATSSTLLSFFDPLEDLEAELPQKPDYPRDAVAVIGSVARMDLRGVQQTPVQDPDWYRASAVGVNDGYLAQAAQVYSFSRRAPEFADDDAVWQALRTRNDVAVATQGQLQHIRADGTPASRSEPDMNEEDMQGMPVQQEMFRPGFVLAGIPADGPLPDVRLTLQNGDQGARYSVQVIAIVEQNTTLAGSGLWVNKTALDQIAGETVAPDAFYLKVQPGADVHAVAQATERAFLNNAINVTVMAESFAQAQALMRGILQVFQGFLALGLLVGIAALGVISTRTVVERRQQVGMLRAIGFQPGMVALSFLLESSFIALTGIAVGTAAGVLLGQSLIAGSLEGLRESQVFSIPWREIAWIVLAAYGFSLLTTILPALQASRIYPAEALRYE